ncbi:hypothetical protein IWW52_005571, partial [Coemansia sp. RSA 2704]
PTQGQAQGQAQAQQQQQRMFSGTNVPIPAEMAAEIDRQISAYRAQLGPNVDAAQLQQLQQIQHNMEQQMLMRLTALQQSKLQADAASTAGLGTPQAQAQQPVRPMAGGAGQVYAANQISLSQHLGMVSMLPQQHVQVLFAQLRAHIPQPFGSMTFEQFAQYLNSGQLASIQYVNQALVMMVQSQQQLLSGAAGRPVASLAGMPPGLSPQQQQLQLQQLQRAQMQQPQALQMGVRPQGQFMSPSLAHTQLPQQAPTPVNRAAATPTPSQTGSQRGVKRKSVNSSPAPPQQAQVSKSPRMLASPKKKDEAEAKPEPPDTAKAEPEAGAAVTSQQTSQQAAEPAATTAAAAATTAAPSSSSSQELLADLTKSIAGSTIAHMSPVASSTEAPTNGAAVTATPQTAAISAAVMASLQSMSPAQRQLLIMQHHQQQQQQLATTAASMAAMVPQLSPQQQQQQQHQQQLQQQHQNQQQQLLQIQMALVQAVPNFVQLPPPVQQTLMTAFAQQRQLHHQQQQLQAALATQPLTQQTRGVYMAQAATVQAQLQSVSQALAQNVAYARSLMAVTSAAPAASAAAVAASTGGPDGSGSALFLQSSGNASEPTVTQAALTADASAAANGAGAGGGLKQPADKQTLAANFREEPSPQPTVMATDQIGKVLNSEQQATLGKWQREAARIARANAFRLRETAGYEQREAAYRAVLEEQRVRNADAAQRLRREREAEAQAPWNAGYSGLGNGTTGGAGYGTRVAGPGGVALVLP